MSGDSLSPPPPPPPPPPPLPQFRPDKSIRSITAGTYERINMKRDQPLPLSGRFVYTNVEEPTFSAVEEIRRICRIIIDRLSHSSGVEEASKTENDTIWIAHYRQVTSVLQDGPKCGLVALAAVTPLMNQPISIEVIFEQAKLLGYTLQGEMFSAANLCKLAEKLCPCRCELIYLPNDYVQSRKIFISHLAKGHPILVPYDADRNHEPICKKGQKAHWAAITGLLSKIGKPKDDILNELYEQDSLMNRVYHAKTMVDPSKHLELIGGATDYVLAKQGKSRHTDFWSLASLLSSNANLTEIDPSRLEEIDQYVVPEGGLTEGLCKQIILLSPT